MARLSLLDHIGWMVESTERIEIEAPGPFMSLNGPLTADTAKHATFSTSMLVALARVDGKASLAELADESLRRPLIEDLARKVAYAVNGRFTNLFIDTWPEGEQCWPTSVAAATPEETIRTERFSARGGSQEPLSCADVVMKFLAWARCGQLAEDNFERTLQIMQPIEELEDVTGLFNAVQGTSKDAGRPRPAEDE